MPPSKSAGRPASGAPGIKMLITAASLAATVGGWAMLSNAESAASSSAPGPAQSTTALSIKLAPLPTLVPPPDPKTIAINFQSAVVPGSNQPVAAPAAAAPSQIAGLRVVNAPAGVSGGSAGGSVTGAPAPVTTTRSSKP
jgi:hypothetical protein